MQVDKPVKSFQPVTLRLDTWEELDALLHALKPYENCNRWYTVRDLERNSLLRTMYRELSA